MYYPFVYLSTNFIQNGVLVMPSLLVNALLKALFVMVFDCFTPHVSAKAHANAII